MVRARRRTVLVLMLATAPLAANAPTRKASTPERRCGWLVNETPGNFELIDRHGNWTIAEQGGYQARGFDGMPDMSAHGWVETNGPHGHGCACMTVATDRKTGRVTRLVSARPVPLARCTADRTLPKP